MAARRNPKLNALNDTSLVWIIPNVLSLDACQHWIQTAEDKGFMRANDGLPGKLKRHNARLILDLPELAAQVYEKVRHVVPQALIDLQPKEANKCLRFYKYLPGDFFKPHQDTDFFISPNFRSLLSVVVYLNDDYQSGELYLPATDRLIPPSPGQAVVFAHRMVHESRPILSGTKYAFRSDIIYHRS